MKRVAFKMFLKPGNEAEYEKRHNEIWPELKALFKEVGVSEYSIFWDKETNALFAVKNNENDDSRNIGDNEIVKKWWAYMADIMATNPDNSPVLVHLKEIFYMK